MTAANELCSHSRASGSDVSNGPVGGSVHGSTTSSSAGNWLTLGGKSEFSSSTSSTSSSSSSTPVSSMSRYASNTSCRTFQGGRSRSISIQSRKSGVVASRSRKSGSDWRSESSGELSASSGRASNTSSHPA